MAWSVLQSASSAATATATTKAVAFSTANLTSGTKIICALGISTALTVSVTSVSDGTNNLTQCGFVNDTANSVAVALYALDTPAGDVGAKPTITATLSTSLECSIWIAEVSGLAAGNTTAAMLDGTMVFAGFAAGSSHAQPAYTSTALNEFLIVLESDNGGPQTVTQPGGYTLDAASITNNSLCDIAAAYKNSANGAETGTWTFGGSTTGTELGVVAFKIAGGAITSGPPLSPQFMGSRPMVTATNAGWRGAQHSR